MIYTYYYITVIPVLVKETIKVYAERLEPKNPFSWMPESSVTKGFFCLVQITEWLKNNSISSGDSFSLGVELIGWVRNAKACDLTADSDTDSPLSASVSEIVSKPHLRINKISGFKRLLPDSPLRVYEEISTKL